MEQVVYEPFYFLMLSIVKFLENYNNKKGKGKQMQNKWALYGMSIYDVEREAKARQASGKRNPSNPSGWSNYSFDYEVAMWF